MPSRTNFLPRLIVIGLVGSVPIVTACGGKTVSLGKTDQLDQLDTSSVASQTNYVGACPAGFAHPNICCEATATDEPTCGEWENDKFRACDSGWSTYPNAASCCSLSNPANCIDTPEDAGVTSVPPPAYGCGFICPPGSYSPPSDITPGGPISNSCCTYDPASGITACEGVSNVEPVSTCVTGVSNPTTGFGDAEDGGVAYADASVPRPVDAGGGVMLDAGYPYDDGGDFYDDGGYPYDDGGGYECDAGSSYPPGYDGGIGSLCNACPPGWAADPSDPVLCCQSAPTGVRECFSQAVGSSGGFYDDGGVSTEPSDGGIVGISDPVPTEDAGTSTAPSGGEFCSSASSDSCSCQNSANGHDYTLDCSVDSSGKTTCFCEEDGSVTSQFTPATATCSDLSALGSVFSASNGCGYPAP
jgi:hypothetical protein